MVRLVETANQESECVMEADPEEEEILAGGQPTNSEQQRPFNEESQ